MRLDAYVVGNDSLFSLSPASAKRSWMDGSPDRFANRCLPLRMANQAGWCVRLKEPVDVLWTGRRGIGGVQVEGSERVKLDVASHFGNGIVTFRLPWLFRTEPGYNLLVRGPANDPKDGLSPLEGLVETDWSVASFTMNWQITRPHQRFTFGDGDTVCMLVPSRRGELESFRPRAGALQPESELAQKHKAWRASRTAFLRDLNEREPVATRAAWQRDYFVGRDSEGQAAPEHQMKLALADFRAMDDE